MASSALGDLLATTESVGDDQPVVGSAANGGEKFEFSDRGGDCVFVALEAKGSGHATASRRGRLEVDTEAMEKRLLGGHLHDRFVMAVSVEHGFARQLWQGSVGAELLFEKFTEQESLAAQGLCAFVVREKVDEFVAEDGDAGWLESDDGDSGFDLGLELIEDLEQQSLGAIEHAEVVEGASATEVGLRDEDAESSSLKDLDGGLGGAGEEVVVEGVGPEENLGG